MNIFLWILQIILAIIFLLAGANKAFNYNKAKEQMTWMKNTSKGLVLFIGAAEILGAIGLIVPYALGIAPILTPIAALALVVVMVLASLFHAKRKEFSSIGANILFIILLIIIAIGRF